MAPDAVVAKDRRHIAVIRHRSRWHRDGLRERDLAAVDGRAWHPHGPPRKHVIERVLERGETLRVDTGCLVGFDEDVDYSIRLVGGVTSKIFGGEGLFLASLEGPGRVWMQTMPFSRFADRVVAATAQAVGES